MNEYLQQGGSSIGRDIQDMDILWEKQEYKEGGGAGYRERGTPSRRDPASRIKGLDTVVDAQENAGYSCVSQEGGQTHGETRRRNNSFYCTVLRANGKGLGET